MVIHRDISPTDIDGLVDLKGNAFVYLEGKLIDAELPRGQRLALENVCKSHEKAMHPTIAIVYTHNVPRDQDVIVKDQFVKEVFWLGKWRTQHSPITVLAKIHSFKEWVRTKRQIEI